MSSEEVKTDNLNPDENQGNGNAAKEQSSCEENVKNLENEISNQDEEIIRLNKEIETLKDLLQRRQADFENFRKRTIKLQEEYRKLAIKDFACDIINISDDITRAINASQSVTGGDTDETKNSFIEGIRLVLKRLEEVLKKYGIEEIDAENKPFNPNYHEALEIESSTDHNEDTVVQVYQRGFKLDEHLVRSAKVKVAKPIAKDSAESSEETKCS
jgi:molecular chaperone GrpE